MRKSILKSIVHVEVSGKTFHVKDELKRLGLWWDHERKVWRGAVSEWDLAKLHKLADKIEIEIKTRRPHEDYEDEEYNYSWVRCWECGRLVPPGQATRDTNGEWYCGC